MPLLVGVAIRAESILVWVVCHLESKGQSVINTSHVILHLEEHVFITKKEQKKNDSNNLITRSRNMFIIDIIMEILTIILVEYFIFLKDKE
uniref:Uncharacterized protein n=1 Tax=Glossina brevipalpis TaxID=37001 RepID=A0A1A9WB13_9MUSC